MRSSPIQGPLTETTFLVLLSLFTVNHGYGCGLFVEEVTEGRVVLGPGTLYGAIKNLEEKGWIAPKGVDGSRKYYLITEEGKRQVYTEIQRMQSLLRIAEKIWEEQQ